MKMKYFVIFFTLTWIELAISGYIYDRGLGADCLYDEDCLTRNSFCKGNKICACKLGYKYDAGSDICFPKELDLKCNEDYDCSALQNARCNLGFCRCKNDFVASNDKSTCLPSMRLTSVCEEDSQCNTVMNRSACDYVTRQCVCQRGFRRDLLRMQCVEIARLHSNCLTTDDCEWAEEHKGKVECRHTGSLANICVCREGFVEINEICYSVGSSITVFSWSAIFALVLVVKWML